MNGISKMEKKSQSQSPKITFNSNLKTQTCNGQGRSIDYLIVQPRQSGDINILLEHAHHDLNNLINFGIVFIF